MPTVVLDVLVLAGALRPHRGRTDAHRARPLAFAGDGAAWVVQDGHLRAAWQARGGPEPSLFYLPGGAGVVRRGGQVVAASCRTADPSRPS